MITRPMQHSTILIILAQNVLFLHVLHQQLQTSQMSAGGRQMEDRFAVYVAEFHFCFVVQQQLHHVVLTINNLRK